MFFKRRKKAPSAAEVNAKDREIIEKNAKLAEVILVWVKDAELRAQVEALKEELTYLIPSHKEAVVEKDRELQTGIEKVIALLNDKSVNLDCAEFANMLTEIKANIKMRNAEL